MNSFRHAFKMSHKKCNAKFCYRVLSITCPYRNCLHHLFNFQEKTCRTCPALFPSQSETESTCFPWRSLAFCTPAPRRIWRASRLVAPWACGRLWSWKVLNDDVSNTGTRSKRWTNEWSEIGKMKYIEIESFSNLIVWACAALVVGWKQIPIRKN